MFIYSKLFLILFFFTINFSDLWATNIPLKYIADIEISQLDKNNFPNRKIIIEKKDIPVELKEVGLGLWHFSQDIDEKYSIMINLMDFNVYSNQKRIRLDYFLNYLHDDITWSNGMHSPIMKSVCEMRLNHMDFEGLYVLKYTVAEAYCTDKNLTTFGIRLRMAE
ncbi:MAG: hypothetical protein HQK51_19060 [Oligoflexia bacterium]|nr:hypothetical protein [Oligoflexia bacterium]